MSYKGGSNLALGITFANAVDWTIESSIETTRRNQCLVIRKGCEGCYKYSRAKLLLCGLLRFRCTNRKCKANVFLNDKREIAGFTNFPHSHPPLDPGEVALVKLTSHCKQKIRNDIRKNPMKVLFEEAKTHAIGVEDIPISRFRSLRKVLYSTRKKAELNLQISSKNGKDGVDGSSREASASPTKEDGPCEAMVKSSEETIADDDCKPFETAVDTLLYDDLIFDEPKPVTDFAVQVPADPAVDPLQQSPTSMPLRIRIKSTQDLKGPDLSPGSSSSASAKPEQSVLRLRPRVEISAMLILPDATEEKLPSTEEEFIHSNCLIAPEELQESQDTTVRDKVCQETQTECDEDQAFLDSVLPKMKKLSSSDKAMLKAQILQLIKWKTKEHV